MDVDVFRHKEFGMRIRSWRMAVRLSQGELAAKIGVTKGFVAHIESGRTVPGAEKCKSIARALGVPESDILTLAGHPTMSGVDDVRLLDNDWRLFFTEDWPRLNEDERQLMRDLMGLMRLRVEDRMDTGSTPVKVSFEEAKREYWVYVNHHRYRYVVHKAGCPEIKKNGGRATKEYWWGGPFVSHSEAWEYAVNEASKKAKSPWDHTCSP